MAGSFCTSELAVDSEKPSDTNHQWLRTKVMSSITFPGFCVKSSFDNIKAKFEENVALVLNDDDVKRAVQAWSDIPEVTNVAELVRSTLVATKA